MASRWDLGGLLRPVEDEYHQLWPLSHSIGVGGQGEVWLARGGRTAIKIISAPTEEAAEAVHARLRRIQRLPLDGLPLAIVQALLAPPKLGYVMELIDEMVPLDALCFPDEDDLAAWYLRTGGLDRRLRLLAKLADAIARLHARAIVYQDLSPSNVLVSASREQEEIRLIDVDNLGLVSAIGSGAVYTPGYGAPEIVRGRSGPTTLTDAHALGVLVFETLTGSHPFRGDAVLDADPDYQQEYADRFRLPWIDHPTDRSNECTNGITPREELMSAKLWDLAGRCFGAAVEDPRVRPSAALWAAALHSAAGQTVTCPECDWVYRAIAPSCLLCGRPTDPSWVLRHGITCPVGVEPEPGNDDGPPCNRSAEVPLPDFTVLQPAADTTLTARHAAPAPDRPDVPVARLRFDGRDATVLSLARESLWLDHDDGRPWREIRQGGQAVVPVGDLGRTWTLHFGARDSIHRWVRLMRLAVPR
ncbi:protein kinase domain-containing protein [Streptomyces sp. NBC_00690]|uniref:protein kinase domain-containing protein n=1 Tax=Streptomyces sp. NBC_00690 TaxID=2975808 RepID=UPI002E2DB40F|nr:protein kinase [Streptomyces sp. NBC_00690]